jgi:hypothetical protein
MEASGNWRLYEYGSEGSLTEKDGTQWAVPVTLSVGKVTQFGPLPASLGMGLSWFASAPGDQPELTPAPGRHHLLSRK